MQSPFCAFQANNFVALVLCADSLSTNTGEPILGANQPPTFPTQFRRPRDDLGSPITFLSDIALATSDHLSLLSCLPSPELLLGQHSSRSCIVLTCQGDFTALRSTVWQAITALGLAGYRVDLCDPGRFCLGRFSRFVRRYHHCPPVPACASYQSNANDQCRVRQRCEPAEVTRYLCCSPRTCRKRCAIHADSSSKPAHWQN